MTNHGPLLPGMSLSIKEAILKLPLYSQLDGTRTVSDRMQQAFLLYIAGFKTMECWRSADSIANDPSMQSLLRGVTGRSIGSVIRVLERNGLVDRASSTRGEIKRINKSMIASMLSGSTKNDCQLEGCQSGALTMSRYHDDGLSMKPRTNGPDDLGPAVLTHQDERSQVVRTGGPNDLGPTVLATELNRTQRETTTNDGDWKPVVVVLSEIIDKFEEAIERLQHRGGTPSDAMTLIERWNALPSDDPKKIPGTLFNWFCRQPRPDKPKPANAVKDVQKLREDFRIKRYNAITEYIKLRNGGQLSDGDFVERDSLLDHDMRVFDEKHKQLQLNVANSERKAVAC